MIEFDVLPERRGDGALVLAHDYDDAARRSPRRSRRASTHLASSAFAGIEFDVDLKLPGYELGCSTRCATHGLLERALISSQYRESLAADPRRRAGACGSAGRCPSCAATRSVTALMRCPALVAMDGLARGRSRAGRRAAIRAGECDALMAHWRLVTPRLVRRVRGAGGELYVWTVDELPRIRALEALGVTGVITNDPRLFAAPAGAEPQPDHAACAAL